MIDRPAIFARAVSESASLAEALALAMRCVAFVSEGQLALGRRIIDGASGKRKASGKRSHLIADPPAPAPAPKPKPRRTAANASPNDGGGVGKPPTKMDSKHVSPRIAARLRHERRIVVTGKGSTTRYRITSDNRAASPSAKTTNGNRRRTSSATAKRLEGWQGGPFPTDDLAAADRKWGVPPQAAPLPGDSAKT